jgi:hypothetical protein
VARGVDENLLIRYQLRRRFELSERRTGCDAPLEDRTGLYLLSWGKGRQRIIRSIRSPVGHRVTRERKVAVSGCATRSAYRWALPNMSSQGDFCNIFLVICRRGRHIYSQHVAIRPKLELISVGNGSAGGDLIDCIGLFGSGYLTSLCLSH